MGNLLGTMVLHQNGLARLKQIYESTKQRGSKGEAKGKQRGRGFLLHQISRQSYAKEVDQGKAW